MILCLLHTFCALYQILGNNLVSSGSKPYIPLLHRDFNFLPPLCDHKKFWACSKQLHKGCQRGWFLLGHSNGPGGRHTHQSGNRRDAQRSANGHTIKECVLLQRLSFNLSDASASLVQQMNLDTKVHGANMGAIWGRQDPGGPHVGPMNFVIWVFWLTDIIHWAIPVATTVPPFTLSHHGNGSASTLPSSRDLLCLYNSFCGPRKAQDLCCSSYTETWLSRFRWPVSVLGPDSI